MKKHILLPVAPGPETCAAHRVRCAAGIGVVAILAFWRFCLGIGIGGDYPLSATITSEYASSKR